MRWIRTTLMLLVLAPLAGLAACQLGMLQPAAPSHLGVTAGRLAPPSATDNSVSSQASLWPGHPQAQAAQIAPLALPAGLALDEGWARQHHSVWLDEVQQGSGRPAHETVGRSATAPT
jgi:hypothetical protein